MKQRTVRWAEGEIVFSVKRSRRRTVALRVEPGGAITVYAPYFVWGPFLDEFVHKQRDWILKKLAYFKDRPVPPPITAELRAQLQQETAARLPAVVARIAERLGVAPKTVKVAHQTSRWGSCSTRGTLRFSWRMARLPEPVFEYIVIHELAHLKVMNHSARFWAVVESLCPDHKAHRTWLRKNS